MNARLLPFAGFVLLLALLGFGIWWSSSHDLREVPSPLIGKPAPAFALPLLHDPSKTLGSKELAGQPYLLNVFASWCVACRDEHRRSDRMNARLLPFAGFLLVLALLGFGIWWSGTHDLREVPSPLIGKPAPTFSLPLLNEPSKKVGTAELAGHPYLLNVFASWCVACRDEHPILMLAHRRAIDHCGRQWSPVMNRIDQYLIHERVRTWRSVHEQAAECGDDARRREHATVPAMHRRPPAADARHELQRTARDDREGEHEMRCEHEVADRVAGLVGALDHRVPRLRSAGERAARVEHHDVEREQQLARDCNHPPGRGGEAQRRTADSCPRLRHRDGFGEVERIGGDGD